MGISLARLAACVALAGLLAAGPVAAARLYKWVDEKGEVHYTDTPPPEAARHDRAILNEQGIPVKRIEGEKTPEELAAERRRRAALEARRRAEEARRRHDRMLLATYATEADMVAARDEKIATLETLIRLTRQRIRKLETELERLRREAAEHERAGRPVSEALRRRIRETRRQIRSNRAFIAAKRREQDAIRAQFERDIQRFRELKAEIAEREAGLGR